MSIIHEGIEILEEEFKILKEIEEINGFKIKL